MKSLLKQDRTDSMKTGLFFISTRRLIFFSGFVLLFLLTNLNVHASVIIFSEDKAFSKEKEESFFSEKRSHTDKRNFWGEEDNSIYEDNIFESIADSDDPVLYAPPTGETGNPQKIAPLGAADVLILMIISFGWIVYRFRKSGRKVLKKNRIF